MITKQITLTKKELLIIFNYVHHSKPATLAIDRAFNTILDKLTKLGFILSDDSKTVYTNGVKPVNEVWFTKDELYAIEYALLLRLHPESDFQVTVGIARNTIWPLAKGLGIEKFLRADYEKIPSAKNINFKLDDE